MSQPPPPVPPPPADDLQFDTAEPVASPEGQAAPASISCVVCSRPITDVYFAAGDNVVCPQCRDGIIASRAGGSAVARLFKAGVFGLGAGLAGAAIWWVVHKFVGQFGIIAVLVGFMVGGAVRAGSDRRGGLAYQLLAVLLTYLCISLSYAAQFLEVLLEPEVRAARGDPPMAFVVIEAFINGLIYPFARGATGILGLLIIGFALWEAWQLNRHQPLVFNGPYQVGPGGAAPPGYPPPPPPASAPGVA
jgi:hypothetical protein